MLIAIQIKEGGADIFCAKLSRTFFQFSDISMSSEATESPSGPLDTPVSDIHIAKIAQDFIRKWEELAPYLRLLPAREYEIKKVGAYDDQKREALRMWKRKNGRKATYRALIVIAEQVSDAELAENIEALVAPQPTLIREDRPSPAADLEKIQRDDGSAKVPEAHAPGHYKRVFVLTLHRS